MIPWPQTRAPSYIHLGTRIQDLRRHPNHLAKRVTTRLPLGHRSYRPTTCLIRLPVPAQTPTATTQKPGLTSGRQWVIRL